VGSLRSIGEALRFFGKTDVKPTAKADKWKDEIISGIKAVLKSAAEAPSFVDALYQGIFGDKADGVYPGRAGKNSVITSTAPKNGRLGLRAVEVRKNSARAVKSTRPATLATKRYR
jgi:hypothetical protein